MATEATLDEAKIGAFVNQIVGELGATLNAALVVIGDKLGLYQAMADAGPLTSGELAERTGTSRALRARVAERPGGRRLRRRTTATSARYTLPAGAGVRARRREQPVLHARRVRAR